MTDPIGGYTDPLEVNSSAEKINDDVWNMDLRWNHALLTLALNCFSFND